MNLSLQNLYQLVAKFNLCDIKEELKEVGAGDKSRAAEQDTGKVSLQDGNNQIDQNCSTTRRLDSLCRPDIRILSCANAHFIKRYSVRSALVLVHVLESGE
jgi:hypothetical protein